MIDRLDVRARGNLRHHAAERGMFGDLRQLNISQDAATAAVVALDHGGGGFIAGRFDAKNDH
jgi:hypothetical protein